MIQTNWLFTQFGGLTTVASESKLRMQAAAVAVSSYVRYGEDVVIQLRLNCIKLCVIVFFSWFPFSILVLGMKPAKLFEMDLFSNQESQLATQDASCIEFDCRNATLKSPQKSNREMVQIHWIL